MDFDTLRRKEYDWIRRSRGLPEWTEGDDPPHRLLGLAFSGGGVRSATFNLGVLQALAKLKLLREVDYLSTVSGGGYIGSWLTALLERDPTDLEDIERRLAPDDNLEFKGLQPPEVRHLREYANVLTPRKGLLGADTWTAVTTYIANLVPNVFIFAAAICLVFVGLRFADVTMAWFLADPTEAVLWGVALMVPGEWIARDFGGSPFRRGEPWSPANQGQVQLLVVLPMLLGSWLISAWVWHWRHSDSWWPWFCIAVGYVAFWLVGMVLVLLACLLRGRKRPDSPGPWFFVGLAAGAALAGALAWVVGKLFTLWDYDPEWMRNLITCGAPLLALVITLAVALHVALMGRGFRTFRREFWYRMNAWLLIYGLAWLVLFGIVFHAPRWIDELLQASLGGAWILTTVAGVLVGRRATPESLKASRSRAVLVAAAPYLFILGLLIALSFAARAVDYRGHTGFDRELRMWILGGGAVLWGLLAYQVDVNLFSMHYYYRNRLARAYLGASPEKRKPHPFTRFDAGDDFRLDRLRPHGGPYPIYNAALNLVGGSDLAWQDRKASSFVMTPRYSGYTIPVKPAEGRTPHERRDFYLPTRACISNRRHLSVATAVAISGAAASPNMGFRSSAGLSFLLAFFNVRLGWWMGNPRYLHKWRQAGPSFAPLWLFREMFGLTNHESAYVYLSDGAHFENLGVYELVRRRCRYIIVTDAGQDGDLAFDDLGNAIRKCRTDLGIDIRIDVDKIRRRDADGHSAWHCAVGTIHYEQAFEGETPGTIVFLKSSLTGDESSDVLNYARRNAAFPHQSTADLWFDEEQFESYRRLGYHVASNALELSRRIERDAHGKIDREKLFVTLRKRWYPPSRHVARHFTKHGEALAHLFDEIRSDPEFAFLDAQFYPEWPKLIVELPRKPSINKWLPHSEAGLRRGFYLCNSMIQLMENVFLDLDFETEHDHPDNRGWMNLFHHWSWSAMFRVTWAVSASTYGARFQSWCKGFLDLDIGKVEVRGSTMASRPELARWLAAQPEDGGLTFLERHELGVIAEAGLFGHGDVRVWQINVCVDDAPRSDEHIDFPVGCALTVGKQVAYIRVQDHVRTVGIGDRALQEILRELDALDDEPQPFDVSPPLTELALTDSISERDVQQFRHLLRSAWLAARED